jgi:ABC-type cobalt transport system substrate-binding protein
VLLPIQKSAAKSFAGADSEINSKIASLTNHKSTAQSFFDADSEISSKTASLPSYKSATKLCHCRFIN